MDVKLHLPSKIKNETIAITGSKSETNRLLLLKALYPNINILNESESDDSKVMYQAMAADTDSIDIHHAGTAMRFLTAYFAMQEGREVVLTGSQRMKERPIKILVDALRDLGANIEYVENKGFPPLKIRGCKLPGGKLNINANVSSQYITALLLIASNMQDGLELVLEGDVASRPYITMTLALLEKIGVECNSNDNVIAISPLEKPVPNLTILVESDWSSASYFYSIVALAEKGTTITLATFKTNSLQGDSKLAEIYERFGVFTEYHDDRVTLQKQVIELSPVELDLKDTPDIAQTIAVTCLGLGIDCRLKGLHTLKIKETDRLAALKNETEKFGANVEITDDAFKLRCSGPVLPNIRIKTYDDHRMAMAFAPLAVKVPIIIEQPDVVTKSYPDFWKDLTAIGINVTPIAVE